MKLIGMTKTIQDPKTQFNKQVETMKRSQCEMKMELKSSITQLEHSRESLTGYTLGQEKNVELKLKAGTYIQVLDYRILGS